MGDRTNAEALRLAKAHLEEMGWKYTPEDIGKTAAAIVVSMQTARKEARNSP